MLQLLRKIAFPFSLIYTLMVYLRNFLYDIGFFSSRSFNTPTVCIGNLSVGGTGKTPMIEYLVRLLKGNKVAVLSRGYRRKSKGFLLAEPSSAVADLGDEPYQLYRKFPHLHVAVDADRRNGISQLQKLVEPDIILLDDAFQHRKVKSTYAILLTTYDKLYVDDWYLPTGNLRDSKRESRRADLIIVTKCPHQLSAKEKADIKLKLKPRKHQKLLFSHLEYGNLKSPEGTEGNLEQLKHREVALVTGIANPRPLVDYLKANGLVFKHHEHPDHHNFTEQQIKNLKRYEVVLTTEKDFVRLQGKLDNILYLEIAHAFSESDLKVLEDGLKALF
ncbi:lipid-A-disaccharide kinase [Flagellimonas flava]|uniref:Tetraacyldisaccharide 4'-kinase n=2 Tax=Flagellimonas flava TaxID=570519 RepID=A0A1M5PC09_9FLAO|nr:lipid-A-disaccharide kinase [Allomuricauda flava]